MLIGKTGAKAGTFREGVNINQSLSDLTRVIEVLSENAANPRKPQFVPYRNSKLTRILKDSLGGNSRTAVICALTPAAVDETKNTLRYEPRRNAICTVTKGKLLFETRQPNYSHF